MITVPEMEVVKILAKLANGMDCKIGQVSALGKDQVSQPRSNFNDLLDSIICQPSAACEIQYP
jgi:hypothetical protein